MTFIRFSDGLAIDTSGPYRVIKLADGYYVVGHGMLSGEPDKATADEYCAQLKDKEHEGIPADPRLYKAIFGKEMP